MIGQQQLQNVQQILETNLKQHQEEEASDDSGDKEFLKKKRVQDQPTLKRFESNPKQSFDEQEKEWYNDDDDNDLNHSKIVEVLAESAIVEALSKSTLQDADQLLAIVKTLENNQIKEVQLLERGSDLRIGKTDMSKVLKCQRPDKRYSAIKIIEPQQELPFSEIMETKIWNEVQKIHSMFGEVGSATLYHHFNLKAKDEIDRVKLVFIQMEYLEKSLFALINDHIEWLGQPEPKSSSPPITTELVCKIIRDLLSSLMLMHMNGIVHLDIKPQNIMYHQVVNRWVFIDFGAAELFRENDVFNYRFDLFQHSCTPEFVPEEMAMTDTQKVQSQSNQINPFAVDIWSVGIVFLQLTLLTLQASDPGWGQKQRIFDVLRVRFGFEYKDWIQGKTQQRESAIAFFDYMEKLTGSLFLNLNRHDMQYTPDVRLMNHLQEMLRRNPNDRITIYELAVDLNLPVLHFIVAPTLLYAQCSGSVIQYPTGLSYEGDIDRIDDETFIRQGQGKLLFGNQEVFSGDWENDQPVFPPQGISIQIPVRQPSQDQAAQSVRRQRSTLLPITVILTGPTKIRELSFGFNSISLQSLRERYYQPYPLVEARYYLTKDTDQIQFQAENLLSIQRQPRLEVDMPFRVTAYTCHLREVQYSAKIVQSMHFNVQVSSGSKSFTIMKKLKCFEREEPTQFYNFLCHISSNAEVNAASIEQLLRCLLFLIKQGNFVVLLQKNRIQHTLEYLKLPLANISDSFLLNLVLCFQQQRIKEIDLSRSIHVTDVSLRYLIVNKHLTNLTSLMLSGCSITDLILEDLGPLRPQLHVIDFGGCESLKDITGFFSANQYSRLRTLALNNTAANATCFEGIWTNPSMKELHTLDLQGCHLDGVNLSSSSTLLALQTLNLQNTGIKYQTLVFISTLRSKQSVPMSELNISCNRQISNLHEFVTQDRTGVAYRSLDVSWTSISASELQLVIDNGLVDSLVYRGLNITLEAYNLMSPSETLDLCEVILPTDEFVKNIKDANYTSINLSYNYLFNPANLSQILSLNLQQLHTLDLTETLFDEQCLQVLIENKSLTKLNKLILNKCPNINDKAVSMLARSSISQSLVTLSMAQLAITDVSLESFVSTTWGNLKYLSFRKCIMISNDGALLLLEAKWLCMQLVELDLSSNTLSSSVLKRVLKCLNQHETDLHINLSSNPSLYRSIKLHDPNNNPSISKSFLLSLCESPNLQVLMPHLKFGYTHELSDPIFAQILQSKQITPILSINVSHTKMGPMSIRMIADTRNVHEFLQELHLVGCKIGDLSLSRLLRKGFPRLRLLDLSQTKITDKGINYLLQLNSRIPVLEELYLDYCQHLTISGIIKLRSSQHFKKQLIELSHQPLKLETAK